MAAIYRRLQRVGFQTAVSIACPFRSKPPGQHVKSYLSAKVPTCSKETNQKTLGHKESSFARNSAKYVNGIEENEACSVDSYPIDFKRNHQKPPRTRERKASVTPKNDLYEDIEAFSTKLEPRAFQQSRPEYKSMCYNSECLLKTSAVEGYNILQKVTYSLTPSEVSEFLGKLSYIPGKNLADIRSNAKFKTLQNLSTSNLRLFTNSELISCLCAFVRLRIPRNQPILKIYEQEFCLRVQQLSTDELLLVADAFRYISFQVPKFLDAMYGTMQQRYADLSLPQLIQLVYIIGEGRQVPQDLMKKMDSLILKHLEDVNLEEIGTACLGFFKTGNGLSTEVMLKFGEIVAKNIDQVSNLSLVNLLKMFRFTRVDYVPFFKQVGQDVCKRIPEMALQSIMHVVLTFASMHILDEDLMNAVALAIPDRLSYCRSKDLAKFLWSFGILGFTPQNSDAFYSAFINQIRNNLQEFERFPEHFLTCLMGLAFCQQFPFDLINIALSDKFVIQSSKKSTYDLKKDIFTIAAAVEIECPEYTGNTISPEFRKEITDTLVEHSTQDIYTRREVITAEILMKQVVGGPEYVKEHMILPHVRSKDLEVHLDANRKPIAINSVIKEHDQNFVKRDVWITDDLLNRLTNASTRTPASSKDGTIENPENLNVVGDLPEERSENVTGQSEVIKLAIQVTNRNNYLYSSQQLLGLHAMKRRHLRKLGYIVVEVPYWEWFPLVRYGVRPQQLGYLHHKVFNTVSV